MTRLLNGRAAVVTRASVAATVEVRPLGGVTHAGTRCYLVELGVSLGAMLEDLGYDDAALHGLAAELRTVDVIIRAEPDVPIENRVRPLYELLPGCTVGRAAAPNDVAWAPRLVGLFDLLPGGPTGAGVRIGHIDTGFTLHPELDAGTRLDRPACTTTLGFGGDGTDPMLGGSSHGTATASVLTSTAGTGAIDDRGSASEGITGLAPGAVVVSVRAIDSVVVADLPFFPSDLAEGVWHCIDESCDVITMSFGGVLGDTTKDAIREAYERDIILCASAGNCVRVVVEPAALGEVIGCGGVGLDPVTGSVRPWRGTSRGSGVDISAPAENVWVADWADGSPVVRPGEGTSFASPYVAGAAALWLDHHGRPALEQRYSPAGVRLGDVFRSVVRSSADRPAGWDTAHHGAGIVHVPSLLGEPLPDPTAVSAAGDADLGAQVLGELLDRITVEAEPTSVVVDLDEVVVRDDGEAWGGAEPYLMAIFFKIDGETARIEATFSVADLLDGTNPLTVALQPAGDRSSFVRLRRTGGHGSLDPVNIGPLELHADGPTDLSIDGDVGRWEVDIDPIPIRLTVDLGSGTTMDFEIIGLPGFVGVLAILGEEDFTPDDAVLAARNAVGDGIRELLEDVLEEVSLADLSTDPEAFVERQKEIADDATAAAASRMDWWETFWGGVVDPDDQLVQCFAIANVAQLGDPVRVEGGYSGAHGDWTLVGEIRLD